MSGWFSRLTLNQKLALAAVALGAVALFAAPYPGSKVTLDARELALVVGTEADHVEAPELAAWIIENRADYRLVDLQNGERVRRLLHPDRGEHPDERPARGRTRTAGEDRALLRGRHPLGAGLDAAEGPGLQVGLHAEGRPRRVEGPGRVPGRRRQPDARRARARRATEVDQRVLRRPAAQRGGRGRRRGGNARPGRGRGAGSRPGWRPRRHRGAARSPPAKKKKEGC